MTKYECRCAANNPCRCVIECSPGIAPFRCCLTGDRSCNWSKVEDQEVETPAPELPEWFKVGAWCYIHSGGIGTGKYQKIEAVHSGFVKTEYLVPIENISEARLRPWNDDEMKSKVGKVFEMGNGDLTFCLGFSQDRGTLFFAGKGPCPYSAEYLAETDWKLDGSPCGVLEHYEQGKWVK